MKEKLINYRLLGHCKFCNVEIFGTHHNKLIAHQRFCKLNPNLQKSLDSIKRASKRGAKISAVKSHIKAIIRNQKQLYTRKCDKCNTVYSFECSINAFQKGIFQHYCSKACANSHIHSEQSKEKISDSISKYLESEVGKLSFKKRFNHIIHGPKQCVCEKCGNSFELFQNENGRYPSGRFCSIECREKSRSNKLSISSKLHKTGGYKLHGGKGHRGRYHGYWCDSSWELAYVIYNLEHNIKFSRNTKGFEYD